MRKRFVGRMLRFSGVVLVVAGVVAGSRDSAGSEVKGDLARIQGRWVTRAGERHDIVVRLTIDGSRVAVEIVTPQGVRLQVKGEIRVHEDVLPRALDWVHFTGADAIDLPEVPAIYEFRGDGTLRVCNGGPNNPRPSEFKPGAGVLADLHVFEREKPADSSGGLSRPTSLRPEPKPQP